MTLTLKGTLFGIMMAWVSFSALLVTGILSVVSLIVDLSRVRKMRKN